MPLQSDLLLGRLVKSLRKNFGVRISELDRAGERRIGEDGHPIKQVRRGGYDNQTGSIQAGNLHPVAIGGHLQIGQAGIKLEWRRRVEEVLDGVRA